jgi:branched-chain amino acid transport system substrate-binding protein
VRACTLLRPLALAATASLAISSCGAETRTNASRPVGKHLTIYSSLPLAGAEPEPLAGVGAGSSYPKAEAEMARARSARVTESQAQAALAGEQLALEEAGGRVGRFRVSLVSLSDATRVGEWSQGATAADAARAAHDKTTIAYIGDWNSGASAISLPLTNAAGVLQVSPTSSYVGLTSPVYAGQDDPERFYPTGKRSFVRLLPGDVVEGAAEAELLEKLGVKRLYVMDDGEPFDLSLAAIVAADAHREGVHVLGETTIETAHANAEANFEKQLQPLGTSGAEAVFFSGQPSAGAETLWEQMHAVDRALTLLGSSQLAEPSFAKAIGAGAAASTYLTTPALPDDSYPSSAERVLAALQARDGRQSSTYALCGYEAMSLVLAAIKAAGARGDDREAVVEAALRMQRPNSVLGSYSVLPNGETTLTNYAVDRISGGEPVFWRKLAPARDASLGEHLP